MKLKLWILRYGREIYSSLRMNVHMGRILVDMFVVFSWIIDELSEFSCSINYANFGYDGGCVNMLLLC